MKAKEQKVEYYYELYEAQKDMDKHIKEGWFVHTCTMSGNIGYQTVLVVYEKDLESWN